MKKSYKILLILGGCLCAGGIVVSTASFAALGFQPDQLTTKEQKMMKKTYQHVPDGITALEIKTKDQAVEIIPTEENNLTIQYNQLANGEVQPVFTEKETANGKTLKMEYYDNREWWKKIRLFQFYSDDTIRVYLPAAYRGRILVETINGPIKSDGLSLEDTLTLKTTNGSIHLQNTTAAGMEMQTTNGPIRIENCTASADVLASTANAGITVSSLQAASLTGTTSNGAISVKSSDFTETCTLKNSSGGISLAQVAAQGTLSAATTNTAIRVSGITAADIVLNTTNAAVTGTVAGPKSDYSIITNTTNASNHTPSRLNENASKNLTVQTTNGKIDIQFE